MKLVTKFILTMLLAGVLVCGLSVTSYATVPHTINYQGKLLDSTGKPVADGTYNVTFKLYDNSAGSNPLWSETQTVTIQKGIFNTLIGDVTTGGISLAFDKQYYLGIQVGSDTEMRPLQQLASSAYALSADNAIQAQNAATVNNIGASTTATANKLLPLDTNAKLPIAALKCYDSGWFAITTNTDYLMTHNLGTTAVITCLYFSPNANGSPCYNYNGHCDLDQAGRGNFRDAFITLLTTAQIQISTSGISGNGNYVWDGLTNHNHATNATSGYCRIIMLALG